ncbi:MAG TPA: TIM barrel protein [Gemmatimonadaceae bacterium]|nr:TIM barrel protein [Gemmatimonadaceae bacterium]
MDRRTFVRGLGAALATAPAAVALGCARSSSASTAGGASSAAAASTTAGNRRLKRVGIQLYTLRDAAGRDLERTLADIAQAGYNDVELLGSMSNFGMAPDRLRQVLDRNGLRAPSTHVGAGILDDLDRNLDVAKTLGHEYLTIASFPEERRKSLDDYRYWADRMNQGGQAARRRDVWLAFHNHADDFAPLPGGSEVPYDVFTQRTDPSVVRLQLDTGNLAMAGRDPIEYMRRFGPRYWSFHIKDVPSLGAHNDTELGKGVLDFKRLLGMIDRIDEKHLFVEQETYPGDPLDSVRRDHAYISTLTF